MRILLYGLMALPVVVTGAALALVIREDRALSRAHNLPLPSLGEPTQSQDPLVRSGQDVFNAKGCVFCHGPNGTGGVHNNNSVGGLVPALSKVAEGYSDDELRAKILAGVREVAKEDPVGPAPPLYMPSWKTHLTDQELTALVAFLKSLMPAGAKGEEW